MKYGIISDIQHFSVSDGEGIRTTVFFKGCNLKCKWCHNPECISFEPQEMHYEVGEKHIVKICGREVTAEEVLQEILEDKKFYDKSNGGVTFSGGEPLLQADFLVGLMKTVKQHGIHTIVDTAGDVDFNNFEKVIPYTDTFFFDIKAANEQDYREYTGGNFQNILSNLRRLIERNCDVVVRIPIIPKHNFSEEYMRSTCELLKSVGVKEVNLLPFHRLGSTKYSALGFEYDYKDVETLQKSELNDLFNVCKQYFKAKIDG